MTYLIKRRIGCRYPATCHTANFSDFLPFLFACPFISICHLKNSISVLSLPPHHAAILVQCMWSGRISVSKLSITCGPGYPVRPQAYTQRRLALPDGFQEHASLQTFLQLTARGTSVRKKIMSNANSFDLPALRQILLHKQNLKHHQLQIK